MGHNKQSVTNTLGRGSKLTEQGVKQENTFDFFAVARNLSETIDQAQNLAGTDDKHVCVQKLGDQLEWFLKPLCRVVDQVELRWVIIVEPAFVLF